MKWMFFSLMVWIPFVQAVPQYTESTCILIKQQVRDYQRRFGNYSFHYVKSKKSFDSRCKKPESVTPPAFAISDNLVEAIKLERVTEPATPIALIDSASTPHMLALTEKWRQNEPIAPINKQDNSKKERIWLADKAILPNKPMDKETLLVLVLIILFVCGYFYVKKTTTKVSRQRYKRHVRTKK